MNQITRGRAVVGKILAKEVNYIVKTQTGTANAFTLTPEELMSNIIFLTGTPNGGFNVIFNIAYKNFYTVINQSGQTATLKNAAGATTTLADGSVGFIQNTGVDIIAISGQSGTQATLTGAQTLTNKTLTSPIIETAPKVTDDSVFSLGTTLTNDATKMTLEYDKTTTGIGIFNSGTSDNPHVLNTNPGASVKVRSLSIVRTGGDGDCNDLVLDYKRAWISGVGDSGLTVVGDAPRVYVGITGGANNTVASAAYASQPWAKHEGTGAITAMSALSALVDVNADNFTASTVNAGHFHIEGGATVTGQYDGVMIEAYPDVRSMDSLIALVADSGAVTDSIIRTSGTATNLLNIAAANTFAVIGTGGMHREAQSSASDGYLTIKVGTLQYQIPIFLSA